MCFALSVACLPLPVECFATFQAEQEREKAILKVTDEKFKCKLCGKLLVVMSQCQLAELDKHSVV